MARKICKSNNDMVIVFEKKCYFLLATKEYVLIFNVKSSSKEIYIYRMMYSISIEIL